MADIDVERKKGPGILPWILGLIALALVVWGITRCSRDDSANQNAAVVDTTTATTSTTTTTTTAPAPAMDTGTAAAGTAGAAGAAATGATAAPGGELPVEQIVGGPAGYVGQTVSGTTRVTDVVSDRGFWIAQNGKRMFVVIAEPQASEQAIKVRTGQTLQLSGAVHAGSDAGGLAGVEARAKELAGKEQAFLFVQPRDFQVTGQGT